MRSLLIIAILGLAACGADGPPIRPSLGISIGPGGIKPTVNVRTSVGPVGVTIGN